MRRCQFRKWWNGEHWTALSCSLSTQKSFTNKNLQWDFWLNERNVILTESQASPRSLYGFSSGRHFSARTLPPFQTLLGKFCREMNVEPEFTLKSSFFHFFFFSNGWTVEWKLHLAPDRNESHCMSFPVLFYFDISLIHRVLSCVTKYPQCGKICPSCYGRKSNRVGGFRVLQRLFYRKETSFYDMKHGLTWTRTGFCLIAPQVQFVSKN